ncbi:MAG TPA: hypothetical protein VGL97_22230 [Bryobacteraceae bacterium]
MTESGAKQAQARSLGRRLVFWEFARASWQYDLVVGLILLFIFAVPRDLFRDQPRAASVVLMSSLRGANRVFIATELLDGLPERQRVQRAEVLIHQRTGKSWHVVRVEPIRDEAEQEVKGFIAYTAQPN